MTATGLGALLAFTSQGCGSAPFSCSDASDCKLDGLAGFCEPTGYCSFGDAQCPSQRRYGDLAPPDLAGQCVDDPSSVTGTGTGSATTPTTNDSTTAATNDSTTGASNSSLTAAATEGSEGGITSVATTATMTGDTGPVARSGTTSTTTAATQSETTSETMLTEIWGDVAGSDHPGTLQDTWINTNLQTHADDLVLRLYTWPSFSAANVILMRWDLSQIAGATIVSAELTLHVVGYDAPVVEEEYQVRVHRILDVEPDYTFTNGLYYDEGLQWTANPCCANDMPMAQADISEPEATTFVSSELGPVTWDVTTTIQALVDNPQSDHGFVLNPDTGAQADADRIFASTEAADVQTRPALTITYVPSP